MLGDTAYLPNEVHCGCVDRGHMRQGVIDLFLGVAARQAVGFPSYFIELLPVFLVALLRKIVRALRQVLNRKFRFVAVGHAVFSAATTGGCGEIGFDLRMDSTQPWQDRGRQRRWYGLYQSRNTDGIHSAVTLN